jgi:dTDP-glucose 4,6-dehydratase
MTILVTGGAGFIGSNFLHHLVGITDDEIICIDKLTYAADWNNIPDPVKFYTIDIASQDACDYVFSRHKIKTIFHLAAESHVDNSIKDCSEFISTNIIGTVNLLNFSLQHEVEKFIHVSTDEVYGTVESSSFDENTKYNPRNPYSASKASSDHFVKAYHNTYGFPAIVTNCSNNYGPRQHKEKLIPKTILNLLEDKKVPIYGDGKQIRDWIYVQDHCEALWLVSQNGKNGESYCIGGECEIKNIDLVKKIISLMGKDESVIEYIDDRLGHDRHYSTSILKIKNNLKWKPHFNLNDSLQFTIEWYERCRN